MTKPGEPSSALRLREWEARVWKGAATRLLVVIASSTILGVFVLDLFDVRDSMGMAAICGLALIAIAPWAWRGMWADGVVALVLLLAAVSAWKIVYPEKPEGPKQESPAPITVALPREKIQRVENKITKYATLVVIRSFGKPEAPTKIEETSYDIIVNDPLSARFEFATEGQAPYRVELPNEEPPNGKDVAPILRDVLTAKALYLLPRPAPTPTP